MSLAVGDHEASGRRRGSVLQLAAAGYMVTALGMITGPVVARALGPTERGEYASVAVYSSLLIQVLSLGLGVAMTHAMVNRLQPPQALLGAAVKLSLYLTPFGLLGALLATEFVLDELSGTSRAIAIILLALAPAGVLGLCLQSFMLSSGALGSLSLLRAAPLLLNFVGVIGLALVGGLTLSSYLVLTLGTVLLNTVLAWRVAGVRPGRAAPMAPLLRFGARAYVGSFAGFLNFQLDQALLVTIVTPAQLAFYAVAVTIAQVPQGLAQAIGARAVGSVATEDKQVDAERAGQYFRMAFLVSAVVAGGLAILGPLVVPFLYGKSFAPVVAPLLLLLPGSIILAGSNIAGVCLIVTGRPGVTTTAQLAALAVTAIGLAATLGPFGIKGAAAVSSIAYLVRFGVQMRTLRREGITHIVPRLADARLLVSMAVRRLPSRHRI